MTDSSNPTIDAPVSNGSLVAFIHRNIKELYTFRYALAYFVVNNLRKRYHRSILGFFWSLLVPICLMGTIATAFALVFKMDFKTFSMYIISGMAPWGFLCSAIQNGATSLLQSEGFLKKVYAPKSLFTLVSTTTELLNFLFTLAGLYIIALMCGFPPSINTVYMPVAILVIYIFGLGLALICAVGTVYFRDLTHITQIITSIFTYALPIIYTIDSIPKEYHFIFYWNPFFYFVDMFRTILLGRHPLELVDIGRPFLISLVTLGMGVMMLKWRDKDLIFRL